MMCEIRHLYGVDVKDKITHSVIRMKRSYFLVELTTVFQLATIRHFERVKILKIKFFNRYLMFSVM